MVSTNITVDHATTGLVTAEVTAAEQISPTFMRLTIEGEELAEWRHLGYDQWFRLAIPVAGEATRFDRLSQRFDMKGYLRYVSLPRATRPAIRNYTVREFDPASGRMLVDFVLHGADPAHAGIAGPWAESRPVGARVGLIDQGCGYRHFEGAERVVLVGEETALPAVAGILRDLPRDAVGHAIIEVPDKADREELAGPEGVEVRWLIRTDERTPGAAALEELVGLAIPSGPLSAFVAGEQKLASGGRRHLVGECGFDKAAVDFCGYWRAK
ncbi:siderophore-interacting protein [Leucobacter luti]|uniref:siderophore-interacting protein n=1 Tax=Leucobacter luti TaxID=340320 RepID=UPI003D05FF68